LKITTRGVKTPEDEVDGKKSPTRNPAGKEGEEGWVKEVRKPVRSKGEKHVKK